MPIKIKIPASEILQLENQPLVLDGVDRCSRCNQKPANYFEIHKLRYRAGIHPGRLIRNRLKISKENRLKIPVCEICFQSDFLNSPESLDYDGSPLTKIAQFHSLSRSLGGLLAALGFLLLTPLVPNTSFLQPLKQIWQIPVVIGVIVLLLTWLSQRKYQSKVLHELEEIKPGFRPLPRAETFTPILVEENDLSTTALVISLDNTTWAEEVAAIHHWTVEKPQKSNPEE